MKKRFYMSVWISFLALAGPAVGDTVIVSGGGDILVVEPGTYSSINFNGKNITVVSSNPDDASIVAATIIDANGLGSVVTFANGEGRGSVLQGFTVTGGAGTHSGVNWQGGGIYCLDSSPTIAQNVITNNHVLSDGGGVYSMYDEFPGCPLLSRNQIKDNSAHRGGAVYSPTPIEIYNSVISGNTAGSGSALYLRSISVVKNNLIYNNTSNAGANGVFLNGAHGSVVTGNTIVGNSGAQGGANLDILLGDNVTVANNIITDALNGPGVYVYETSMNFKYNDVWNNAGGNYVGLPDQTGIKGNISQAPLFASEAGHDYHLQGGSLCIDSGDPGFSAGTGETDIDGQPRVLGDRVDIGADEYVGYVKPVADAGPDQYLDEIQIVTLDGSGSFFHDPNGTKIFQWTQIVGPAVTLSDPCAAKPSFMPALEAEYSFELIVGDGKEFSSPDTVLIVVGNRPPVAVAGPNSFGQVGWPVYLDGSGSYDPDPGDELTYFWTQLTGPPIVLSDPCSAQPSFVPALEAEYSFELVVSDGLDYSSPDTVVIVVCNRSPVAVAGPNSFGQIGERVYLDGSGSYDPDAYDELTYSWHQVEGPNVVLYNPNTAKPYFNPIEVGRYTFELVVSDGTLTSLPDTVSVDALKSGLLLYFSFDGSLGADLPDVITDDSGNDFEFTRYASGTGTVTYGESSPVVATGTASADFFPNAGFYRIDPSPPEIVDPLRLAGNQYTVEFWMKPGPLNGSLGDHATLIGYRNKGTQDSASWRFDLNYAGGRNELRYFHLGQDEGDDAPDVDEWCHVAGVFNRNAGEQHRMEFFLDGELFEDASIWELNPSDITEPIGIGCTALQDGTFVNFYEGLLDEIRVYNMALPVCQFQLTAAEEYACCPKPEDGQWFIDPCNPGGLSLSWRAGEGAQWHDVYFGTDAEEVGDADTSWAVYKARQGRFDTFYLPPESLENDQTYYWRVDEIDGPNTIKGRVWSFRTSLNVVVYHRSYQEARYPARNGLLWTWGDDEIVVGFEIEGQQSKVLSRSTDGGMTWSMFDPPHYAGDGDAPVPSPGGINFTHPDFAMRVSGDVFWVSYDRCASWQGPYQMSDLGLPDSDNWQHTSVTDYVVKGPNDCLLFMSAHSAVYDRDSTFCVRTTDGGATFEFEGWIVPPSEPNMSVMTSTIGSGCLLSSAVQRVDSMGGEGYVDLFVSFDEGRSWELRSRVGETGKLGGDPAALLRLQDGRLCCVYGHRNDVRMYMKYSYDEGRTWEERIVLRDDWGGYSGHELGYPRIAQLPDGRVVCAYYWSTLSRVERYIAATIWSETSRAELDGEVENLRTGQRYALIQDAICRAEDGDEIVAYPGTYYESINFHGKDLKVRSVNPLDPSVVAATVVHGWGRGPVVTFEWGEDSSSVFSGFTVTDGNCGIDCNGSSPSIRNCLVKGNKDMGIRGRNTDVRITGCTIRDNGNAGLDLWSQRARDVATMNNCTITRNGAEGVRCVHAGVDLSNCLVVGNRSDGLFLNLTAGLKMANCTVVGNGSDGIDAEESRLMIDNCIIRDNWQGQIFERYGLIRVGWSDITGGWFGDGNIDADPCFVELGYWCHVDDVNEPVEPNDPNAVWVGGDYHLLTGSPCVDRGQNQRLPLDICDMDGDGNTVEALPWDLDCNPRVVDGNDDGGCVVDMGAYEYFVPPVEAAMTFTPQGYNPGSEGNWFKLHFVLPDGYNIGDVNLNSRAQCALTDTGETIGSDYVNAFIDEDGLVEVEAAFARSKLGLCLSQPAERTVTVMGFIEGTSGPGFCGTDTFKVINNTLRQIAGFASYWLAEGCDDPDWCGGVDLNRNGEVDFADFAMFDGCSVEIVAE